MEGRALDCTTKGGSIKRRRLHSPTRHMGCPCNYVFRTLLVAVLSLVIWLMRKTIIIVAYFLPLETTVLFFASDCWTTFALSFGLPKHYSDYATNISSRFLCTAYCTLRPWRSWCFLAFDHFWCHHCPSCLFLCHCFRFGPLRPRQVSFKPLYLLRDKNQSEM